VHDSTNYDGGQFIMDKKIVEVLKELGVPMGNLGFKYIREAMYILNIDPKQIDGITKPGGLYFTIAKKYGSVPTRVERAIRHAIESSFLHVDVDVIRNYFGNTADLSNGKLTNRNFLAALAYAISEDKPSTIALDKHEIIKNNDDKSCALCGAGHKLVKVDDRYLCMVCLHKANLSLTENI
jgi:hypothetical protein